MLPWWASTPFKLVRNHLGNCLESFSPSGVTFSFLAYNLVSSCNFSFCFSRYFSYLLICLGVVNISTLSFITTVAPVEVMAWADVNSAGVMVSLAGLNGSGGGQCYPAGISRRVSNTLFISCASDPVACPVNNFAMGNNILIFFLSLNIV